MSRNVSDVIHFYSFVTFFVVSLFFFVLPNLTLSFRWWYYYSAYPSGFHSFFLRIIPYKCKHNRDNGWCMLLHLSKMSESKHYQPGIKRRDYFIEMCEWVFFCKLRGINERVRAAKKCVFWYFQLVNKTCDACTFHFVMCFIFNGH